MLSPSENEKGRFFYFYGDNNTTLYAIDAS